MLCRPLSADCARHLAEKAGVRCALVRKALHRHEHSGRAISCTRLFDGAEEEGMPPSAVFVVTFSHGFPDDNNNGWAGLACLDISNQKELNRARQVAGDLLVTLRSIDCEWINL